jgi:dihydrofolate reductase
MSHNTKTILYIAMSVDGYIAGEDDDLSFLSLVEKPGEDYGYAEFMKGIDTVIMGRRTYDWIITNAPDYIHKERVTYVITHQNNKDTINLKFYSGDLKQLLNRVKLDSRKDIFIEGGAEIIHQLLDYNLIDEFIISIIPHILGKGIRLFKGQEPPLSLNLEKVKQFDSGLIQLHYSKKF